MKMYPSNRPSIAFISKQGGDSSARRSIRIEWEHAPQKGDTSSRLYVFWSQALAGIFNSV